MGLKNTSVMNLVNEEGDWVSGPSPLHLRFCPSRAQEFTREQLDMTYERRLNEFEMITKLTNPVVKKLLERVSQIQIRWNRHQWI